MSEFKKGDRAFVRDDSPRPVARIEPGRPHVRRGEEHVVTRVSTTGTTVELEKFPGVHWRTSRFYNLGPAEPPFGVGDSVRRVGEDNADAARYGVVAGRVFTVRPLAADRPGTVSLEGAPGTWEASKFELVARAKPKPASVSDVHPLKLTPVDLTPFIEAISAFTATPSRARLAEGEVVRSGSAARPGPVVESGPTALPTTPGSAVLVRSRSGKSSFGGYVLGTDGTWHGGKTARELVGVEPIVLSAYDVTVLHDAGAA